jgi:hypothetical protein
MVEKLYFCFKNVHIGLMHRVIHILQNVLLSVSVVFVMALALQVYSKTVKYLLYNMYINPFAADYKTSVQESVSDKKTRK